MRFWNVHDGELLLLLRQTVSEPHGTFVVGPDGGVGVYLNESFVGVWVEQARGRFSFVPAARLQATHSDLAMAQVADVTKCLLRGAQRNRRQLRLIA